MFGNAKNICKSLVKSITLLIFVLPKNSYIKADTYFVRNTASLLSGCHIYAYGCSLARNRKGLASFVVYIIKLSDPCQRTLKVASRYKVSALHLAHRSLSTNLPSSSSRAACSKKLRNLFAESRTLCTFAVRNVLYCKVHKTYPIRITAGFSGLFQSLVQYVSQTQREPRSFCIHTQSNFYYPCETLVKAVRPRIIVRVLHLAHRSLSTNLPSSSSRAACSKKLRNLFAELRTLCTFVSARMIYEGTAIIARFPRTYLVCRSCQRLGASLPFIHTLINFCFAKWQERTKVPARIIVPLLHLAHRSLSTNLPSSSSRAACSKKLRNLFAESRTLCTFVFGESTQLCHNVHTHYAYIKRCLLSTSACAVVSVLQNLTRQRLFCCPYITITFNDEWRTELKAPARSRVRLLHLAHRSLSTNLPSSSSSTCSRGGCSDLSHRRTYTAAGPRSSPNGATTWWPAGRHSLTRSWINSHCWNLSTKTVN